MKIYKEIFNKYWPIIKLFKNKKKEKKKKKRKDRNRNRK